MKYILYILIILIIIKFIKTSKIKENFSGLSNLLKDDNTEDLINSINSLTDNGTSSLALLRNQTDTPSKHVHLGNISDNLINFDIFPDERSSIGINSYNPDDLPTIKQKLMNEIVTYLPNIKCSNGKDPFATDTCTDQQLQLDTPTDIKLPYTNKIINSLDPNDTTNYCNKNILRCGCNPLLDSCEGTDSERNNYPDICTFHYNNINNE